jgi:hypothetical protein
LTGGGKTKQIGLAFPGFFTALSSYIGKPTPSSVTSNPRRRAFEGRRVVGRGLGVGKVQIMERAARANGGGEAKVSRKPTW